MKTIITAALFLGITSSFAHAAASKEQCEKAMKHLNTLAGIAPNEEAAKNNVTKCQKQQTPASIDCILAAKAMGDLAACKPKK